MLCFWRKGMECCRRSIVPHIHTSLLSVNPIVVILALALIFMLLCIIALSVGLCHVVSGSKCHVVNMSLGCMCVCVENIHYHPLLCECIPYCMKRLCIVYCEERKRNMLCMCCCLFCTISSKDTIAIVLFRFILFQYSW